MLHRRKVSIWLALTLNFLPNFLSATGVWKSCHGNLVTTEGLGANKKLITFTLRNQPQKAPPKRKVEQLPPFIPKDVQTSPIETNVVTQTQ